MDSRKDNIKEAQRKIRERIKTEMIEAYGGKCSCCGEQEPAFLSIDHIDGRGDDHRKKVGKRKSYRYSGQLLYSWLKKRGWPKDNFQLLCMNCNFAKSHNSGGCPHQLKQRKAKAVKV